MKRRGQESKKVEERVCLDGWVRGDQV
jgi:hypothetical protein